MPATTLIGLDIGSTSIRAVEATLTKDRPMINNFGQAVLPPGAVVGGVVKDEKAVTAALRQLWTSRDFSTKSVVLGVTHQQVIVREIDLANLPAKERRQALPFLVRDILPLPVEQALLDFYPLEKPGKKDTDPRAGDRRAEGGGDRHRPGRRERRAARGAGRPRLLRRAARVGAPGGRHRGAARHRRERHQHHRAHRRRAEDRAHRAARRRRGDARWSPAGSGIPITEAETLKCRAGLQPEEHEEGAEVVAEAIRPLVSEIRSSFNYFAAGNPDTRIKRLALVGGAALLPGLPEQLTEELGVPAFLSDPLQRVNDTRKGGRHDALGRLRSSAAVSIGLTLGAA